MTERFYTAKRQEYMASGASPEVKEAAIKKLDKEYLEGDAILVAQQDMEASAPDYELD